MELRPDQLQQSQNRLQAQEKKKHSIRVSEKEVGRVLRGEQELQQQALRSEKLIVAKLCWNKSCTHTHTHANSNWGRRKRCRRSRSRKRNMGSCSRSRRTVRSWKLIVDVGDEGRACEGIISSKIGYLSRIHLRQSTNVREVIMPVKVSANTRKYSSVSHPASKAKSLT